MKDFKPMLATNIKPEKLHYPVIGSVKLEGVRGEFTPDGLYTRPMKRFNNKLLEEKFERLCVFCAKNNIIIEGEFYIHGMDFSDISSICRRANHPDTDKIEFHIFDLISLDQPDLNFDQRLNVLKDYVIFLVKTDVKYVLQEYVYSVEDAYRKYEAALLEGYEGYVFKAVEGTYKYGRSTANEQKFLRMKAENTYDGVVLEIVERMQNLCESEYNELGKLSKRQDKDMKAPTGLAAVAIVQCREFEKPVRVSLSRGIKDYESTSNSVSRKQLWEKRAEFVGKNLRFVGLPVPGMDLPRAPRFDVWRTDLD